MTMTLSRTVLVAAVIWLVHGCATAPSDSCENGTGQGWDSPDCQGVALPQTPPSIALGVESYRPDHLIATDLINALTQLSPYNTPGTPIKLPAARDTFMQALEQVLVDRGYSIERTNQRTGKGVLMSSVSPNGSRADQFTYMVAIDRVALKRDYYIGRDRIVAPISSLYLRGASTDKIQLNDGLFLP